MRPQIPDDLGNEVAEIAASLNLDMNAAIREALESWVARARRQRTRLPDHPTLDETGVIPYDLPRSPSHVVNVRQGNPREPDGIGLQ